MNINTEPEGKVALRPVWRYVRVRARHNVANIAMVFGAQAMVASFLIRSMYLFLGGFALMVAGWLIRPTKKH